MRRPERGFALPTVLFLLILVSVGSLVIVTRTQTGRREAQVHATSVQAFWAVEGAIETASQAVRDGDVPPTTLRIAEVDVVIEAARSDDRWSVRARTHPNAAEVHVTLDAKGRQTSWKRVR